MRGHPSETHPLGPSDLLASAFRDSPTAMSLTDAATGRIFDVNVAYTQVFGYRREEFVGQLGTELPVWVSRDHRDHLIGLLRESGEFHNVEIPFYRRGGELRQAAISGKVIDVEGRRCILFLVNDITGQAETQRKLDESRRRFEVLFRFSPIALILSNPDTATISDVNLAMERLSGYSRDELVGKTSHERGFWTRPDERGQILTELRANGQVLGREMRFFARDRRPVLVRCSFTLVEWDGAPNLLTSLEDIAAEKQALETQKLDALGRLTGGIAHDFNNLLAAILGNVELLELNADVAPEDRERMAEIRRSSLRARDLVRQVLAFSRRQVLEKSPVDVASLAHEVARLLQVGLPAGVALDVEVEANATITADAGQIHQVLMNLGTNAVQAVGAGPGRIVFRVACRTDGWAAVTVEDSGHGIAAEHLPRLFEPFFTTKKAGEGTGLGLSVVHGLVADHGGRVEVDSEVGRGTRISVLLPTLSDAPRQANLSSEPARGKGESLLLVDDDHSVLESTRGLLVHFGYRVRAFDKAEAAWDVLSGAPADFSLVLTDLNLPGMGGLELARRVANLRSDLPVLVFSGNPDQVDTADWDPRLRSILSKPILATELAEELQRLLR